MYKRGGAGKVILIILMIIVAIAAIYFTFFFAYKCEDIACFRSHQEKCSRTKFTNNLEDAAWFYHIKGKKNGECKILVEVLQVKEGTIEKLGLNGKSMECYLQLGSIASPEADLLKCHGELKEELQTLIINKLHAYVVENVGEIGEELRGITSTAISKTNEQTNKTANSTINVSSA